MTSITYPNGQVLVSSALTVPQINVIMQNLTCGMLGINPPDYSKVRIDWPTEGQPFVGLPNNDVCFISCVPQDVEYSKVRDRTFSGTGPVTETWVYTKGWRIAFTLYGPNCQDRARALHSAMFMDWVNDTLSLSNIYPVSDYPEITRIPESWNAQWWERADFYFTAYEQVTETIDDGAVTSVQIQTFADDLGQIADITATK